MVLVKLVSASHMLIGRVISGARRHVQLGSKEVLGALALTERLTDRRIAQSKVEYFGKAQSAITMVSDREQL